uniref:Uncharacterized protein n=1 Tax=Oryzias latipes TaxID=8090 RepID=A0A3P9H8T0_ORYLA
GALVRLSNLQNLQSQMTEFESSADPLQEWLNGTEVKVQESSARLHDLPAKKEELSKLQVFENHRHGPYPQKKAVFANMVTHGAIC